MLIIAIFFTIIFINYKTRNILLSLFTGAILYSLLACKFNMNEAINLFYNNVCTQIQLDKLTSFESCMESWSIFVFGFILMLGVIVELMQESDCFLVFKNIIAKAVKNSNNVQAISLCMSKLLMIDDYLSCLTVGKMMAPVFDKFKITRTKLAFLVDSMAAPLAILCPISSWSVVILGIYKSPAFMQSSLTGFFSGNSITQHFYVMPYLFYSFAIIFACWFIVLAKISYSDIDNSKYLKNQVNNINCSSKATLVDFLTPLVTLFLSIFIMNLIIGGYKVFGGNNSFIEAFQQSNSAAALFIAAFLTTVITTIWFIYRKLIKAIDLIKLAASGIKNVYPTVFVLILSWTIGTTLTQNLDIGNTIINLIGTNASISVFVILLFLLSLITGLITGTSWGTIAIVTPIAISVFDKAFLYSGMSLNPWLLIICIGSSISGSIAGDHLSPISSTTVMTASGTDLQPIVHTRTQLYYSVPVIVCTLFAFYLATKLVNYGLIISVGLPLIIDFAFLSAIFMFLSWQHKREREPAFAEPEKVYL